MTLHDIFSSEPLPVKETPNAHPIFVDTREKPSLVFSSLVHLKANVLFQTLEVGDYLAGEVTVERKTFSDFLSSLTSGRLKEQLRQLQQAEKKLLILEGIYSVNHYTALSEQAVKGMLLSIVMEYNIPLLYTKDEGETAKMLLLLAKKAERKQVPSAMRLRKQAKTFDQQKQFILEGFPGVGAQTAKKLLHDHPTLFAIFSLSQQELEQYLDEKKAKAMISLLFSA